MSRPIRAIYEGGRLRLLDPVELAEGEEVSVNTFLKALPRGGLASATTLLLN